MLDESTGLMQLLPPLPPETVHRILRISASSSRGMCLTICLVASWARTLVLPHLFCTIVLCDIQGESPFWDRIYTPLHPPSALHVASLLRTLWTPAPARRVLPIFEICENISHIALAENVFHVLISASNTPPVSSLDWTPRLSQDTLSRTKDLEVTILTSAADWLMTDFILERPETSPLISRITHLRIANLETFYHQLNLQQFSHLTHLAIPFTPTTRLPELQSLLQMQSLHVLVICPMTDLLDAESRLRGEEWTETVWKCDKRVHTVNCTWQNIRADWEKEHSGDETLWSKAERCMMPSAAPDFMPQA